MESKIADIVLDFLKEAGKIALDFQYNLSASLKADKSIVTEVDLKISEMFSERIKPFLDSGNHKLLDEENLPDREKLFNDNCEYLWTIDPIDGTTTYFYGFNLWAIGISIYKNYEPYMGFIYLPSTAELIYTDGVSSYYVKNAFNEGESKSKLQLNSLEINPKSIILQHRLKNYDINKFVFLDLYSSYVLAFYTLAGKGIASFFNKPMKLWDVAATLPIAKNIGMNFKNTKTGKNVYSLNSIDIDEDWRLKDVYIMCSDKVYNRLKSEI